MYRLIIRSNGRAFAYYEFRSLVECTFKQNELEWQTRGQTGISFSVERS